MCQALFEAFERAGLQFVPENGGGVGLRFKEAASTAGQGGATQELPNS